jgi:hypothetical protein
MRALPVPATVAVADDLADGMYRAVSTLPDNGDKELCSPALQTQIREHVRASAPAAFDALVQTIRTRVTASPYVAYLTGLRFDEGDLLFVAMSSVVGEVVDPYGQSWSRLVRRLSPPRDRVVPGVGVLSEALHTDGTDSPRPNDFTCLHCVRPDQNGGGRTRLLDVDTLITDVLPTLDAEIIEVLTTTPVPWRIHEEYGGGTIEEPVIAERRLRWLRHAVASPLAAPVDRALGAFESALAATTEAIELPMAAGALLIMSNKLALHARTSIPDPADSQRLVLRTKVRG